jgi:hypothetical protein
MADHDDAAYECAATRWVASLASERPNIGLQDLANDGEGPARIS